MDDYSRNLASADSEQPEESSPKLARPRDVRSNSHFYRTLVTFAICLGLFLLALLIALDPLSRAIQNGVSALSSPRPDNPGTHTISLGLARGVVIFLVLVAFSGFWLTLSVLRARRTIRELHAQRALNAQREEASAAEASSLSEQNQELTRVKRQLEQQRTVLKKIQSQMYEDNMRPRHDFVSFRALYVVGPDGDIEVEKEVILTSQKLEVHFWRFHANGEQYAQPLADETEMNLEVRALDDGRTECIPLLVDNRPTRKEFTVNFLPAITPGTQRAFLLKYRWPGFMRELAETGQTSYYWGSNAFTNDALADFAVEWRFHERYGEVDCQLTRANPTGMSLDKTQRHPGTKWVYAGNKVPLGNLPLELYFSCDSVKYAK
jgi:hypothetical protein